MSATLDADRFAGYWGSNTPRVHIPGRTFPVTDFLLEDILTVSGYIPRKQSNKTYYNWYNGARKRSAWDDSERSDDDEEADESQSEKDDESSPGHTVYQSSL
jgi:HrpA-like RNA helicase